MDDIQLVFESLGKSGTRYRVEKLSLIGLYVVIVLTTAGWVFAGGRLLASRYAAELRVSKLESVGTQNFYITNAGTAPWENVRIVLHDRYLERVDRVRQGERIERKPKHFKDFYRVPRHWGASEWERLTPTKPAPTSAPGDIEVTQQRIQIGSRDGPIEVRIIQGDE